jgi:hypothetical protein
VVFFPWSAVDERDQDWFDAKKSQIPLWQLHQEYPSTPEEAFVGSGNPFFDLDRLSQMATCEPVGFYTILSDLGGAPVASPGGEIAIWEHPNPRVAYVIGADTAMGLEHGDFSTFFVVRADSGDVVARYRGHMDPDEFGEKLLASVGRYYNVALIGPEINNHGLTTLKGLQRAKYPNIYRRRTFTKRRDQPLESLGWLTTATSKPMLADELNMWLRDHNVPDLITVNELRQFTRSSNGKLSGSPHDDLVMGLGVTIQVLKYAWQINHKPEKPKAPIGSIDWWDARITLEKRRRSRNRGTLSATFGSN